VATEELPDNAKIMTQKGDLLVSTVRPNRGAVAILGNGDLLVSGAFTVLREDGDYPKEVLQVLLRTSMYRDWLLRFNVGTSYPVIKDEDVLNEKNETSRWMGACEKLLPRPQRASRFRFARWINRCLHLPAASCRPKDWPVSSKYCDYG